MNRHTLRTGLLLTVLAGAIAALADGVPPAIERKLKTYQTPFYVIRTDKEGDFVREAMVRMTVMGREYQERTKGYSRRAVGKAPFYIFSNKDDYYAAGGMQGSAGVYMGNRLMAIGRNDGEMWRVVQHEGFHQYVHRVIGGRIPIWVNEGMAEYFGIGVWTGDGYVMGVIPNGRLKQIKDMIDKNQVLPFLEMLEMDNQQWSTNLNWRNYLQAWAMVHFLAHADGNKYRGALDAFITDIGQRNVPWKDAFINRFGRDVAGFEKRFCEWWKEQTDESTRDMYDGAVVQTLTSYLGRATCSGQRFADFDDFLKVAAEGGLKCNPNQWLPESLLKENLEKAKTLKTWTLKDPAGLPKLILETEDGITYAGSFRGNGGMVADVEVSLTRKDP